VDDAEEYTQIEPLGPRIVYTLAELFGAADMSTLDEMWQTAEKQLEDDALLLESIQPYFEDDIIHID